MAQVSWVEVSFWEGAWPVEGEVEVKEELELEVG